MTTAEEADALKRATVLLKVKLENSPKQGEYPIALAELLFRLSRRTETAEKQIKLLTRAKELDPYDVRFRLALGLAQQTAGEYRLALDEFWAAAAVARANPHPWLLAGKLFVFLYDSSPKAKLKLIDRALESFDRALEISPGLPEAHAAKLLAATFARVSSPDRSRLLKLLPKSLLALSPDEKLIPFVSFLGASIAFSLHFPKHAFSRNPQDKLTEAERSARSRGLLALEEGLQPWLAAFPDDKKIRFTASLPRLLDADENSLKERLAAALSTSSQNGLVHLFLHQKLEEFGGPRKRMETVHGLTESTPLVSGLGREALAARNLAAREAILEGNLPEAMRIWREGLDLDPHNWAFHNNLALAALSRRDARAAACYLENSFGLLLMQWSLAPENPAPLRFLASKFESFSGRLRDAVVAALHETGTVDPSLLSAWVGETRASLAVRAFALQCEKGKCLHDAEFLHYIRKIPVIAPAPFAVPNSLRTLLEAKLTGPPPLHYEVLGVTPGMPQDELEKQAQAMRDRLQNEMRTPLPPPALSRLKERIARAEEACKILSNVEERRKYDGKCLTPSEHAFHLRRRQFVVDLHEFAQKLTEKGNRPLAALLLRAYFDTPHESIAVYFDLLQPGAMTSIRSNMTFLRYKPLVDHAQELMNANQFAEASRLLETVVASGGGSIRPVHYFLAVCGLKLEIEHIKQHGSFSGMQAWSKTNARDRAKKLGPVAKPGQELDLKALMEALQMLQRLELEQKKKEEEAKGA